MTDTDTAVVMFDTAETNMIVFDNTDMIHFSQCLHCNWDYDITVVKILWYSNLLTNTEIKEQIRKFIKISNKNNAQWLAWYKSKGRKNGMKNCLRWKDKWLTFLDWKYFVIFGSCSWVICYSGVRRVNKTRNHWLRVRIWEKKWNIFTGNMHLSHWSQMHKL